MSIRQGTFTFKKIRELGRGGLGVVDLVVVTESNCEYPVGKQLACKRLNDKFKDNPEARARFEREIEAVSTLNHKYVVPCWGQNLDGSTERFYFMPVYPGTVRQLIAKYPQGIEWTWVATFGAKVADGMAHAHASRRYHRDLKPENILHTDDFEPGISDWGLGAFVHKYSVVLQALTRGGMGTEYYCSAQQWGNEPPDPTFDVYSLGMLLAEMVEGRQRSITVGAGIDSNVTSPNTLGARNFNELIMRMTSVLPQRRPQTMLEVSRSLGLCHAFALFPAA
jgi:serine/threonine protein kinase